ncbi:cobyrinic acid a,c-diamide synthase domain protein [Leptospira interrogans str. 2006001854]|uniref:Cobyrinic acid a,c-diamide synthase domain protein n=2 Tax=Leptospira interrogans TaxID=173 RepID=M6G8K7_LEPIR|nr:cobyrinic acid a,c-diamide synthase domain protein [Leptospira interrogans serovar Copenhageni str. LT2050]EMM81318.1 cobyrinic acid a,c-diamide synthase domain protein [Leptospira interrogans str. 2006001854]
MGYVEVTTKKETIFGEVGLRFRGHQFRYSDLELDESNPIELVYNLRKEKVIKLARKVIPKIRFLLPTYTLIGLPTQTWQKDLFNPVYGNDLY